MQVASVLATSSGLRANLCSSDVSSLASLMVATVVFMFQTPKGECGGRWLTLFILPGTFAISVAAGDFATCAVLRLRRRASTLHMVSYRVAT